MDSIDIIKPLLSTPLSSNNIDKPRQHRQLDNKLLGTPGIDPGSAGSRSANVIHCAMQPPHQFPLRREVVGWNLTRKLSDLALQLNKNDTLAMPSTVQGLYSKIIRY